MLHVRNVALLIALAGCTPSTPSTVASSEISVRTGTAEASAADPVVPVRVSKPQARAPMPTEAQILAEIARAASSDSMPEALPEFWVGHVYELQGVRHYTGFAYFSGADAAPDTKAVLAQASFIDTGTAAPDWKHVVTQASAGEFGARGRALAVDSNRSIQSFPIADGRLLLAIPVDGPIEQGVVPKLYEILLRSSDGRWIPAGPIEAGWDDSAGCDEGRAFPCSPAQGELRFTRRDGVWPDIVVELTRALPSSKQTHHYRFDERHAIYVSSD